MRKLPLPFVLPLLGAGLLCGCSAEPGESEPDPTESIAAPATPDSPRVADASPASEATGANTTQPDADDCGADQLGRWLNVLPTETVMDEIAGVVGERPIRTYTQGDPVTMDFNPARLNVELGVDGRIKLFRCG